VTSSPAADDLRVTSSPAADDLCVTSSPAADGLSEGFAPPTQRVVRALDPLDRLPPDQVGEPFVTRKYSK